MEDHGLLAWLELYPFGGYSSAKDKKESIQKLMSNEHGKELMYAVVQHAFLVPGVEAGLIRSNLIDVDMRDRCMQLNIRWQKVKITPGGSRIIYTGGELPTFDTDLAHSRARQTGVSDSAVLLHQRRSRRRRREAAVLGHIGRPFEEEDIFMPNVHDTGTVPMDLSLSPSQSQSDETGNHITAARTEVVFGLLTPESESEASTGD